MVAEPVYYDYTAHPQPRDTGVVNWRAHREVTFSNHWYFPVTNNALDQRALGAFERYFGTSRSSPQVHDPDLEVRREFWQLANQWQSETAHLSFDQQIARHPAYKEIIRRGWAVVPLILEALQREVDNWFYALMTITQENPVPPSEAGDMEKMRDRWLEWGRRNGYLQDRVA